MIKQLVVNLFFHISKKQFKLLAIELSKQQTLNTIQKTIQHFKSFGNLTHDGNIKIFNIR